MVKSIYFWVATTVLLAVIGLSMLKVVPPILAKYEENKQQVADAKSELDKQQKFLAAVNAVKQDEASLETAYDQATSALPINADSEVLMLQLDGLLKSLGLASATTSVPLVAAAQPEQEGAALANSEIEVTIAGKIGYGDSKKLLDKLRTFARWNKIKSFAITRAGEEFNSTFVFKAFFKAGKPAEFSGDETILAKAKEVFAGFTSYATKPDAGSEGSYGRDNPFNP